MEVIGDAEAQIQQGQLPSQQKILHRFDVDLSDYFWWCTVLLLFFDPFFRVLVGVQEGQRQILCRYMTKNVAFFLYCILSYSYSAVVFLSFHKSMSGQPRMRDLQRNEALIIGYIFVITGICIKAYIYSTTSMIAIMGGKYFKLDTVPRKIAPMMYDPYYHPLGTSSVICYFGFSVVRASAAGIISTMTLGVACCAASQLERYFLQRIRKEVLDQYTFTPINCKLSDKEDTKNKED